VTELVECFNQHKELVMVCEHILLVHKNSFSMAAVVLGTTGTQRGITPLLSLSAIRTAPKWKYAGRKNPAGIC
jgi:hypothetical protein